LTNVNLKSAIVGVHLGFRRNHRAGPSDAGRPGRYTLGRKARGRSLTNSFPGLFLFVDSLLTALTADGYGKELWRMGYLYGERIVLREYRKEDLEPMRQWVNDPAVVDNLSDLFLFPNTLAGTEQFLNSMLEGKHEAKGFVIADRHSAAYIGQIDLIKIDWKNRYARLGIVIGCAEKRGRGYGTEAIRLIQRFTFERLNLNKLELDVHDYNQPAIRCYQKCGFKEEGRIRQTFYINDRYTDMIVMGILKEEYLAIKEQGS
jgi:RimJ/RimL family protein N-acetyltransferase